MWRDRNPGSFAHVALFFQDCWHIVHDQSRDFSLFSRIYSSFITFSNIIYIFQQGSDHPATDFISKLWLHFQALSQNCTNGMWVEVSLCLFLKTNGLPFPWWIVDVVWVSQLWACKLQHFNNILRPITCDWNSRVSSFRKKGNRKLTTICSQKGMVIFKSFQRQTQTSSLLGHLLYVMILHHSLGGHSPPTIGKIKRINWWMNDMGLWLPLSSFYKIIFKIVKTIKLKIEINRCGLLRKWKLPPFIVKNNSYLWGKL